ncbi:MAG: cupin domain-containing protein [Trueperaceae bacterium]|nr:cupin domain-containing protein [Trueperaceae bacterium]
MSYAPSPRPTFDAPTHIPYRDVTRHLWGDPEAGQVSDWIYASTQEIHQLLFGVPPMGSFTHSDSFRTIFAADEVLYVLSGEMVIANPQTGEVHRVRPGQAAFFRRDTWHHVHNLSNERLRVLEYFSPPPSQGTSGSYARQQENLPEVRYGQDEWMTRFPMEDAARRAGHTIRHLREDDMMWRLEGSEHRVLVGLLAATEHLTAGKVRLLPGQHTDAMRHAGDKCMYVLEGDPQIHAPGKPDVPKWFELAPRDGFFVPHGEPHAIYNMTGTPVEVLFGVGPRYAPPEDA